MKKSYATPAAMEKAIRSKAQQLSVKTGISTGDLVLRFHYQRLLARVFQEEGWMLKGGQALLVRFPEQARASRDADLFRPGAEGLEEALAALKSAAELDLEDFFRFSVKSHKRSTAGAGNGAKVHIEVQIGVQRKDPLSVDVVVKRTPTGKPTEMRLKPAVPVDWPDTWPLVLLYPLQDHVADKICAMYEMHERISGLDSPSTRFRDLADLLLISQKEVIEGRGVQFALSVEVPRRRALGTKLTLPSSFQVPDPASWTQNYPAAATAVTGLRGCQTLDEASAAADAFITPLLAASDPGVWNPMAACWTRH
ncbi:MAG TPA: nucleotidyl transferase AbiEii/AbiGii toxin family protein [Actinocrinis sp.]|nr:nucleotidyl transferase AbiEii/AbiGii toxin family protein [Actinocrinis sp.]